MVTVKNFIYLRKLCGEQALYDIMQLHDEMKKEGNVS